MKNLSLYAFALFIVLSSCSKNTVDPVAINADFSFRGSTASTLTMATGDTCTLINKVLATDSVTWDLGNGTKSTKRQLVLSYPQSGVYTLTQTVINKDGFKASATKKVTILDRVLTSIIATSVYWDPIPNDIDHFNYIWPQTTTADVYVQFQQYTAGEPVTPYSGILPSSPVLFTSGVVPNVGNQTKTAFAIPINGKFIIYKTMVNNGSLVMQLLAKDQTGKVYNLMSSNASGSSWGFVTDDIANNTFVIKCSLMSGVELHGEFQ